MFLGVANQLADAQSYPRHLEVDLYGYPLIAKSNTGAQCSLVPATFARMPDDLQPARETLLRPSGRALQVIEKFTTTSMCTSRMPNEVVDVAQQLKHPLLALSAIVSFGLVRFLCATGRVEERHPELFNRLGLLLASYTIRLNPTAVPYFGTVARHIPVRLRSSR
ncbi:hypothetical protein MTO96_038554 [Rhipicephalus appendiculatus]